MQKGESRLYRPETETLDRFPEEAEQQIILKSAMSRKKPAHLPVNEIMSEDTATDLIRSEAMRPYMKLMMKGMVDESAVETELAVIAKLPLEQRYVWRIASAMKWGFADFDDVNVAVDRETLSQEDLRKVAELIRNRPVQLALFLKALLGDEYMEAVMMNAIKTAKENG
jgi:hypothetical protein